MAKTSKERVIENQNNEDAPNQKNTQPEATQKLKAEQPIKEEIPDTATVVRQYAKWTDNDGNFHKVPLDGTTAIREPAHEQHELTVEDRDNLDEAMALKTPRRDNADAKEALSTLHEEEVRNDEVHQELADAKPVDARRK